MTAKTARGGVWHKISKRVFMNLCVGTPRKCKVEPSSEAVFLLRKRGGERQGHDMRQGEVHFWALKGSRVDEKRSQASEQGTCFRNATRTKEREHERLSL